MPTHSVPRPEYPRPQFTRRDWLNLNGAWQFETDRGDSGLERGLLDRELRDEILVPLYPVSDHRPNSEAVCQTDRPVSLNSRAYTG